MEDSQEFGIVRQRCGSLYTLELGNENGCKGCLLAGVCQRQNKVVQLDSELDLSIGQKVSLAVKPSDRLLSSLVVFVLPIVLMIMFYFLGGLFLDSESGQTIFSFLGLGLGALLIKFIDKKAKIKVEIKKW